MFLNGHVNPLLYNANDGAVTSGTPLDFFKQCRGFSSRSTRVQPDDPVSLGEDWGLPPRIWHEEWSQCSGGEAQRAMLAIAIALKPDILLLDEPTSYHPFGRQLIQCIG
jgi:ABC-type multidrug transport system ATPase subunit